MLSCCFKRHFLGSCYSTRRLIMTLTSTNGSFFLPLVILSLVGALCALPFQSHAQTWTGQIDSSWHKAGNWNPQNVPGPGDNVNIRPNNGNPFPVIHNQDVTVASVQVSNYDGGELTVRDGHTLTITNGLTFEDTGTLHIKTGGTVDLTGGSFDMGYGNTLIDIEDGHFTSETDITIKGDGFNAGTGTVTINGKLNVNDSKVFNVESGDVTVSGTATVNGTYNGEDGNTTFNNIVEVRSGGVMNLDTGTITFNDEAYIRDNGTLNMGSGTVNLNYGLTAESDGNVNVQNGDLNVQGDADFQNNGNLSVNDGSVNVTGDATLQNGGSFDFEQGSMNIGGNASFTNGGTVNAGGSEMTFEGDLTVQSGGNFQADTSTVVFSGDQDQTINTNGNDITFYNVKVDSGSTVNTDGSTENTVTIENDLTVDEGGSVGVKDDDNIDIQGDLNNNGKVASKKPFIYAISTPSLNEVKVTYDKPMQQSSTSNASNYSINNGISVSSVTSTNDSTFTLTVSPQLSENTEYTLEVNNVKSAGGKKISQNHKKRFTPIVDVTYYSRQTGNWNNTNSWSTQSHTGSAASQIPNAQEDEDVVIGNNHTISVSSAQEVSNLGELTVKNSGTLAVTSSGTLTLNQFTVIGNGTFNLQNGGTLTIGSASGIAAVGTDQGNIQTASRTFSSSANYIYNGTSPQQTGSGLPQQVNNLQVNNSSGLTATGNLQVDGTLTLQNGTLVIPSGQGLIANNKSIQNGNLQFEQLLSGDPGWRMISTPIAATYNNFLSGVLTQGYDGAYYDASVSPNDTLQPNVLYFEDTFEGTDNQKWRAPSSASATAVAGLGYNLYLFGDIANDSRYNNSLPDTLAVTGQEHSGSIDLYDAQADSGWHLVGNPYGATIDWDNAGGWTKTNTDQTIYIWDPDSKSYQTWNGSTGSLGNGLIRPFQAFWVKANDANPELTITESAKTFGGNFVGKTMTEGHPEIELQLNHEGQSNRIFFSFYKNAKVGKDPLDGYYLQPPPGVDNYSEIYSISRNHGRYTINALPLNFGVPIEIPISANVIRGNQKMSDLVQLHITEMNNLPHSWEVSLVDRKTGHEISPSQGVQYRFTTAGSAKTTSNKDTTSVLEADYHILADADPSEARFMLKIHPGTSGLGLPKKIDLKQNYPNPFNPTTTIRFTLPIQHEVTLEVFNILGRKVATLIDDESFQAGLHNVNWDASNVASGTYIYRLKTGGSIISKKMTVIK